MACDWLFIDGSSLIFRAFHGVPQSVRAPDGTLVNAVRGFMDTLARLVATRRPQHLAIASDADWRPAWRVDLIPEYKLQRTPEPVPPLLEPQMPVIDAFMAAVGVDVRGVKDYEAEDVIAAWTASAAGSIEIASGDRDLFALVEQDRICVLYPERGGLAVVDEHEVTRRYNIPGRAYADFAVLRGDPSDGLPGLRGVGPVAAAQLIRKHGGIEGLMRDGGLSDAQREYLTRALRVVQPMRTLSVNLPPGRRDSYPEDAAALAELSERYGVSSVSGNLVRALSAMAASVGNA